MPTKFNEDFTNFNNISAIIYNKTSVLVISSQLNSHRRISLFIAISPDPSNVISNVIIESASYHKAYRLSILK